MASEQITKVDGVELPEGAWLPPEIIRLMPEMAMAELKVTLTAISKTLQVGGEEPITLREFEQLTGLTRVSVIIGIRAAMNRGTLDREEIGGYHGGCQYLYNLKTRIAPKNMRGIKNEPLKDSVKLRVKLSSSSYSNHKKKKNLTDSDSGGIKKRENSLMAALISAGVYRRLAEQLVRQYSAARIEEVLGLYQMAVQAGVARGPGWIIAGLKGEWDPEAVLRQLTRAEKVPLLPARHSVESKLDGRLPKAIREGIQRIGWVGDVHEVEMVLAKKGGKRFLQAWIDWADGQPKDHRAGLLRTGLRSGQMPPKTGDDEEKRKRYIQGKFSKFVTH